MWEDLIRAILCAVGGMTIIFLVIMGIMELTYRWNTRHLRDFTKAAQKAREEGRLL